jgi:hypothetical protein
METHDTEQTSGGKPLQKGGFLLSVFAGVLTSLVLSFIPFSPAIGGLVAGYLRRGTEIDGIVVGGISGLVVFAPFFLLLYLLLGVFFLSGAPALLSGLAVALFITVGVYTVGAAMAGGLLGAYVATQLDRRVPVLDEL